MLIWVHLAQLDSGTKKKIWVANYSDCLLLILPKPTSNFSLELHLCIILLSFQVQNKVAEDVKNIDDSPRMAYAVQM